MTAPRYSIGILLGTDRLQMPDTPHDELPERDCVKPLEEPEYLLQCNSLATPLHAVITGTVLIAWLGLAVVGGLTHEPWRDEMRALSLAFEPETVLTLPSILHEGHPILWYLFLRVA